MGRPKGSKNVFSTRINHICKICNKQFSTAAHRIDAKFCSHKCYAINLIGKPSLCTGRKASAETLIKMRECRIGKYCGDKNPRWNGGKRKTKFGYILIYSPTHPNAKHKYIQEHRLVMEKHIGRYLKKQEAVHHINGIKSDNRIDNLMLFPNNVAHIAYHRKYIKNWKG